MNSTYVKKWVQGRNRRELTLLIIAGCILIYAFWYLLISRSIVNRERSLNNQIIALTEQINLTREQASSIVRIAKQFSTNQKLEVSQALSTRSEKLQKTIEGSASNLDLQKNIKNLLKDILNQPEKGVYLLDVKNLGNEPLIPPGTDTSHLPATLKNINKYGVQLTLRSNYFSAIRYLALLEKLPWHLYWESLEYKVIDYPQADIIIKFYILMNAQT
jgi:MSHA biogenesis protein MshJ